MNTPSLTPWDETQARLRELADLDGIIGLAHWDQRVTMPPGGAASRASQLGTLSTLRHERLTHPRLVELSETLDPGDDPARVAALRSLRRAVRQATRTPARPGLACPSYGRRLVCANHGTHGGSATSSRDSAPKGEPARCCARATCGSSAAAAPPTRGCSRAEKATAARPEIYRVQRGFRCVFGINDRTKSPRTAKARA